jgi:hypothetical protein
VVVDGMEVDIAVVIIEDGGEKVCCGIPIGLVLLVFE